jgi:hypothetical protein
MKDDIKRLSEVYHALENDVHNTLERLINQSEIQSKTHDTKCIKVSIFGYTELALINDVLTFLDDSGYEYSIYSDCYLIDLIDILNQID